MNPTEDERRNGNERHQVSSQHTAGSVTPQHSKRTADLIDGGRAEPEHGDSE